MIFFRKTQPSTEGDVERIIVPFMNLRLRIGERDWMITMENHFIGMLEPHDRVVLVSKYLKPPRQSPVRNARFLNPFYEGPLSAINDLYDAYTGLKSGSIVKMADVQDEDGGGRPFYRRYLESEFKRFLFGGIGQKPPKPMVKIQFTSLLLELYERILFPEGEKPSASLVEEYPVVFTYSEDERLLVSPSPEFVSYSRILTGLLRKGKIKIE